VVGVTSAHPSQAGDGDLESAEGWSHDEGGQLGVEEEEEFEHRVKEKLCEREKERENVLMALSLKYFVHRFYPRKCCGHSFQLRVQTKPQGAILCRSSVSFITRGDDAINNNHLTLSTCTRSLRLRRYLLGVCVTYHYVETSAGS
jgi:hypothetical protein